MSDIMKTYRKPDGYTIQATQKAFQLFYKKQGFVPVEDEENTGSGKKMRIKAEADRQEEPEENSSAEVSEESTSAETPEANDREPEEAKPSTKRKKEEKKADSASEQPAG